MNGWMDGWVDGWVKECIDQSHSTYHHNQPLSTTSTTDVVRGREGVGVLAEALGECGGD